jgi:hypothetical protein
MTAGQTSTIYVGQLAVDMYDSTNHDLACAVSPSKTIDTTAKPDKQQKSLTKAVAKLLKNYPPPTRGSRHRRRSSQYKGEEAASIKR